MQKNDRFGKEWSSNTTNQEFPTDQQALQGLSFLGATPPSYGLHDAMFQTLDWKDNWLFDQVKGVTDAYGQTLDLTLNGTRTALADAISFAIANQQVATEAEAGIAPVATQAETDAGTDDAKFVTPLKLQAKTATAAEAQALTSLTKLLSPGRLADAFKGGNQALSSAGYQIFPGGLILQWGSVVTSNGQGMWTYPIAFPNACFQVFATQDATNINVVGVQRDSTDSTTNRTQAKLQSSLSSGNDAFQAFAIGH